MSATPSAAVPPQTVAVRPTGWWRLLLGVLLALSVPLVAQLRLLAPVEQTILFLVPAMAAAALAAWVLGGRPWLFATWGILAVWMLFGPVASTVQGGAFSALARGWVAVLSAAFGLVSIANSRAAFFPRALAATGLAFALIFATILSGRGSFADAGRVVSAEMGRRLDVVMADQAARAQLPEVQEFAERFPAAAAMVEQGEKQLPSITSAAIDLFPALLGLESLALLALGWTLFHRSSRARIGPPLGLLCQFRFNDQLVWGVVLGVTLLVLPGVAELRPVGLNIAVFFGALYALRGLGVIAWFLAPGRPAPVLLVLAACLAGPVVGVFSVGLGLADTWIDWRGRLRPAT
jgi:hypothetical protein